MLNRPTDQFLSIFSMPRSLLWEVPASRRRVEGGGALTRRRADRRIAGSMRLPVPCRAAPRAAAAVVCTAAPAARSPPPTAPAAPTAPPAPAAPAAAAAGPAAGPAAPVAKPATAAPAPPQLHPPDHADP